MNTNSSEVHCNVFEGTAGKLILFGMTASAFLSYIGIYMVRHKNGKDKRTPLVFKMDLSKIVLGQGFAWLVNVLNTHRNAADVYDPLSWYFPTFLADEIFAVPLGVIIGKLVCWMARKNYYRPLNCRFSNL